MAHKRAYFVSCVSNEFASYRDSLRSLLTSAHCEVHTQEHFRTSGTSLLEKLDDYIRRCDAVIHLIGDGVGQLARKSEVERILVRNIGMEGMLIHASGQTKGSLPDFSYTQWEAYLAIFHNKRCFNFLAGPESAREAGWTSLENDKSAQAAHVQRLRMLGRDRKLVSLSDPANVASEVLHDVVAELDAQVEALSGAVVVGVGRPESRVSKNIAAGGGARFADMEGAPELVVVPAGADFIGSPETEEGRWTDGRELGRQFTFSSPFAISADPISVEQFELFVREAGHAVEGAYVVRNDSWVFEPHTNWKTLTLQSGDPIVCVNWYDAVAYAIWLSASTGRNYRLPTESEWEYAARAGTDDPFAFSNADHRAAAVVTREVPSRSGPRAAEMLPANSWGLRSAHGNVWEWCADTWRANHTLASTNGHETFEAGDPERRVVRGGSWFDELRFARSASRDHMPTTYRASNLGFRIVRTI